MAENTFLGLQPYTEADAYRFKGRSEESQELFRLIVRNDYTVCYAESGEGKTSLLNAGVFPLLRQNMFFPIAITFTSDDYHRTPDSFDSIINRCIRDSIAEYNETNKGIEVEYKLCSPDFQGTDCQSALQQELSKFSWWKLRNYKPQAMGLTFTPVFVFDQFEEVFNLPGSIVWTSSFFEWLAKVSSDSCPDEIVERVRRIIGENAPFPVIKEKKDFKAVFSLRKEFIGELDYWGMQKSFIPQLKYNRYCLKALTYVSAKKVMTQQQRFAEDKVEQVLRYFVQQYSREPEKTKNKNLPVIPALLLSVVCDSWEKDINFFSGKDENEIGQVLKIILERFYDKSISKITNELYYKYYGRIENFKENIDSTLFSLIDSNGKRLRIKPSELSHLAIDENRKKNLLENDIIRITIIDDKEYIELADESWRSLIMIRREQHEKSETQTQEDSYNQERNQNNDFRTEIETILFALVDVNGKRVRRKTSELSHLDFDAKYKTLLSDNRIIKISKIDGEDYVEIVHDCLCPIVSKRKELRIAVETKEREERLLKEQVKKMRKRLSLFALFAIIVIGFVSVFLWQQKKTTDAIERTEVYKAKSDSIQELKAIVESQYENLRIDSILLASHLSHILKDSVLLVSKNDSLQQQIIMNQQKDKIIERLEAFSQLSIEHNVAGKLSERISTNLKYLVTNLSISGQLNGTDIALLREMIVNGSLKHLDMENAQIVRGGDAYYEESRIEKDNVLGDHLFEKCTRLLSINIPNSVTRIGSNAFRGCTSLTRITIPEGVTTIENDAFIQCTNLTKITIPHSVKSIGKYAFWGCTSLTDIAIPDGVKKIEESAFYNCKSLTSITIPNGVTKIEQNAFEGCKSLTSITIPDGVTKIEHNTFRDCTNLTSITIPHSLKSIGGFKNCKSLTNITIPDSVTTIDYDAFEGCTRLTDITIPHSVKSIGSHAFSSCYSLTSITIPDGVTMIGHNTFKYCIKLMSVTIPNNVTSIWEGAFEGCTSLTSITIPHSVKSIGYSAFSGCKSLTSITIPDGVTIIKDDAFRYCTNLTTITIPHSVKSIGNSAFYGCTSLTNIAIPHSVKSIGYSAFYECSSLTIITIPDGVKKIENNTFRDCTNLTNITIPHSVKSIGGSAFKGCKRLTSITIPDSVKNIEFSTFYGCTNLTEIRMPNSVEYIGTDAFRGCKSLICITLPKGLRAIKDNAFFNGVMIVKSHITDINKLEVEKNSFGYRDDLKWIVPAGPKLDENKYVEMYKAQPWWNSKWVIEHE